MKPGPVKGGTLPLTGALTMETVTRLFGELTALWDKDEAPAVIDLSGAERIDSAGLALLLEWQSRAQQQGKTLALRNPPADLLKLAALCEADDLLGLAQPEADK